VVKFGVEVLKNGVNDFLKKFQLFLEKIFPATKKNNFL